MQQDHKRTLITTALPYANGPVHIGHLAGVYVPADIYARFLRLRGEDVLMIGGSDEHGVPITIKAREEGVTPQDIVDRYHAIIRDSMKELGITFDIYSRTTSDIHRQTASEFFRHLYDQGKFVVKTSEQPYDAEAGEFLADRYVAGTCPHCGKEAYGDQCEACGSSLSVTDLIDPHSRLTSAPVSWRETTHWYLPLQDYEQALRKWILDGHREWKTNVYGQCKSWLDMGLQPRAVSRDLKWGVPVPVEGAEGKVLYVWFDAPIGYISNTKELLPDSWEKWWKDPETRIINFIGKDNIVFHCIVFPAMLMAYGDGFQLPDNVPANEFLNLEGDKISTSRNWAVWLHEYLRDFPGRQDTLRYVLTANAPEAKDNDFTWADFQARNNNELVAILGNFVNRATVLTHKYLGGTVPAAGALTDTDRTMQREVGEACSRLTDALSTFHFREGLREAMEIARIGNRYLQETQPWQLAKTDTARMETVLNLSLQICANLAIAFTPFTPFAASRLAGMLRLGDISWDQLGSFDIVAAGIEIAQPELLFEKIEDEAIQRQTERLEEIKRTNKLKAWRPEPQAPDIDIDTFDRADIRVGTVLECTKVPKADKLLRFSIDDGTGTPRTIVSGIAQHYAPEELVGKQVCFIANLPPRKLKGIESQGMILSAASAGGKLVVIGPYRRRKPRIAGEMTHSRAMQPAHRPRILIIYTGGTIGMIENPSTECLEPFDFTHLIDNVPKVRKLNFDIDNVSFTPIDSSDMSPAHWVEIVRTIGENYRLYDGFVLLHGTDTMAYTASALSFMLENLAKPVIITGSQLPIGEVRTDGEENLITALQIAAQTRDDGRPMVQEVAILFENYLWRGNRATKMSADNFNAFKSNNYPALAQIGLGIHYNDDALYRRNERRPLRTHITLDSDVMFIDLFPGITERTLRHQLDTPGVKGIVLKTYGAGNAPTAPWFTSAIADAVARGIVIVNVTQCVNGGVTKRYAAGDALSATGVISGADITAEAAITKMMHLFGLNLSPAEVAESFTQSLCGEITA